MFCAVIWNSEKTICEIFCSRDFSASFLKIPYDRTEDFHIYYRTADFSESFPKISYDRTGDFTRRFLKIPYERKWGNASVRSYRILGKLSEKSFVRLYTQNPIRPHRIFLKGFSQNPIWSYSRFLREFSQNFIRPYRRFFKILCEHIEISLRNLM